MVLVMIPYNNYILCIENDAHMLELIDVVHELSRTTPIRLVKCNYGDDENIHKTVVDRIETLNMWHRVLLLTHVPPDDVEKLRDDSICFMNGGNYAVFKSGKLISIYDNDDFKEEIKRCMGGDSSGR